MSATTVTVIAEIKARPGQEAALREVLLTLPGPTRQEAGCINYDLHEHASEHGWFVFHENWRSKADLDRHLATPHVTAALAKAGPLLAEPPRIHLWTRIA